MNRKTKYGTILTRPNHRQVRSSWIINRYYKSIKEGYLFIYYKFIHSKCYEFIPIDLKRF